eukprot:TRINITY_DN66440_c12_g3_i3.p1 TRINITY_DN66440_c12_g3~~TRINITY_DN66440_c12_g3_i3.p1  ORF type:complete len:769 (+),score=184.17 TRINITY_DN66440_c12_g3_i3:714-3020(+)
MESDKEIEMDEEEDEEEEEGEEDENGETRAQRKARLRQEARDAKAQKAAAEAAAKQRAAEEEAAAAAAKKEQEEKEKEAQPPPNPLLVPLDDGALVYENFVCAVNVDSGARDHIALSRWKTQGVAMVQHEREDFLVYPALSVYRSAVQEAQPKEDGEEGDEEQEEDQDEEQEETDDQEDEPAADEETAAEEETAGEEEKEGDAAEERDQDSPMSPTDSELEEKADEQDDEDSDSDSDSDEEEEYEEEEDLPEDERVAKEERERIRAEQDELIAQQKAEREQRQAVEKEKKDKEDKERKQQEADEKLERERYEASKDATLCIDVVMLPYNEIKARRMARLEEEGDEEEEEKEEDDKEEDEEEEGEPVVGKSQGMDTLDIYPQPKLKKIRLNHWKYFADVLNTTSEDSYSQMQFAFAIDAEATVAAHEAHAKQMAALAAAEEAGEAPPLDDEEDEELRNLKPLPAVTVAVAHRAHVFIFGDDGEAISQVSMQKGTSGGTGEKRNKPAVSQWTQEEFAQMWGGQAIKPSASAASDEQQQSESSRPTTGDGSVVVNAIHLSPDASLLLIEYDGWVCCYSVKEHQTLYQHQMGKPSSCKFVSNGQRILVTTNTTITLLETSTGEVVNTVKLPLTNVHASHAVCLPPSDYKPPQEVSQAELRAMSPKRRIEWKQEFTQPPPNLRTHVAVMTGSRKSVGVPVFLNMDTLTGETVHTTLKSALCDWEPDSPQPTTPNNGSGLYHDPSAPASSWSESQPPTCNVRQFTPSPTLAKPE